MNTDLARLCAEHKTLHTDEVADVEQTFENHIVEVLVLIGAKVVARDIDLDSSFRVL